ncbi:MAG: SDR family oxidoreductase [Candidatus Thermoplasmatota archaeon]|nr:SDR family oxidoreductase [Candidatus Thermoplasmatota archaeon]
MKGLSAKTALISGASRGIGRQTAIRLSEYGCSVILHYSRSAEKAEETARIAKKNGAEAFTIQGDLNDPKTPERIASEISNLGIKLRFIVNNAGMYDGSSFHDTTDEKWLEAMRVDLISPSNILRLLAPEIRKAGGGAIVNVSSILGHRPDTYGYPYQAAKAALIHITRGLAIELAPDIRVNAVSPGFIMTDMNRDGWNDSEFKSQVESLTPLKRWGKPEDISEVICFLLSDLSSFITGQNICVDGGKSL